MDQQQDDDVQICQREPKFPDLKRRTNLQNNCETATKTTMTHSSILRPRRLLLISIGCNIFFIGILIGFFMIMKLSSTYCQSNVNMTALAIGLDTSVVGQTAAMRQLLSVITEYVQNASTACVSGREYPGQRPLLLAIHGGSGTGKTYVVDLLAKHFGQQCTRQYIIPLHFAIKNGKSINGFYRNQVTTAMQVPASVGSCLVRLLVLEDVDSVPQGVLSGLATASLTWAKAYVPTMVVMTSSLGSEIIFNYTINSRNAPTKLTLSQLIVNAAIVANTPWGETIARGNLVPHDIYFLPLNSSHLKNCIEKKLKERGIQRKDCVELILKHTSFVESETRKFVEYGCKMVEPDIVYWCGE